MCKITDTTAEDLRVEADSGTYRLSSHARCRKQHRKVCDAWIAAAIDHGRELPHGGNRCNYVLNSRSLREARRAGKRIARKALGLCVTVERSRIVTVMWTEPNLSALRTCMANH